MYLSPSMVNFTVQQGNNTVLTQTLGAVDVCGNGAPPAIDPSVAVGASNGGSWLSFATDPSGLSTTVSISPQGLSPNVYTAAISGNYTAADIALTVNPSTNPPSPGPVITGVTNAASGQIGVVPGGLVTIFGNNLGAAVGQTVLATSGRAWPTQLSGVSVTMDRVSVPIYYVLNQNGAEQVAVQAPFTLSNSTSVMVTTPQGPSAPFSVTVLPVQPGIYILDQATQEGAAHSIDGSIVTSAKPAAAGEYVVLYMTGLGAVTNAPAPGQIAPATPLLYTQAVTKVTIGGIDSNVSFSGLAPDLISLYQVNVQVPGNLTCGNCDVVVAVGSVLSNTAKLPVH